MRGVHPLAATLDTLGPLARTVEDCVLLDGAMRGCTDIDECVKPIELKRARFVVDSSVLDDAAIQPDVARNLRNVVMRLRRHGGIVDELPVEAFARTRTLIAEQGWLGAVEAWSLLRNIVESPRGDRLDRHVRDRLLAARTIDRNAEQRMRILRAELMQNLRQELDDAVLITPTVKHVAPELAQLEADDRLFAAVNLETLSLTMPGSFLDMPGIAMPSGVDRQGLPTSVIFSVPQGHDDRLLRICLAVESALQIRPIQ
jgi:aspartyl-tRNA(Asn)/glutamyl-tRNA(Gln) amidotransferase subunit A